MMKHCYNSLLPVEMTEVLTGEGGHRDSQSIQYFTVIKTDRVSNTKLLCIYNSWIHQISGLK